MACMCHVARSRPQRRMCDLTCAVTPAAPHVFQLGKLHSVPHCRQTIHTISTWGYAADGKRTNGLFKETTPWSPTPSVFNTPSLFMTHGHMIAADWVCPLMFAKARVQMYTHARETQRLEGVSPQSSKFAKGDCCCSQRLEAHKCPMCMCVTEACRTEETNGLKTCHANTLVGKVHCCSTVI